MKWAYYNEIDAFAAQWLKNLISAGHLPDGEVDTRSIVDVRPDDLTGFRQCHFFAGIGGWAYALKFAGWPDGRPVWTGSCPCQPFSVAGKRAGVDDERHLWPDWRWLIDQCRPATIFGEQVASKDGRTWLSGVRSDMEALGYEVGAADLCAASIGAPHIRQRLWFVANSTGNDEWRQREQCENGSMQVRGCSSRKLAHTGCEQAQRRESGRFHPRLAAGGAMGRDMGDTIDKGLEGQSGPVSLRDESGRVNQEQDRPTTQTGGGCGMGKPDSERREQGRNATKRDGHRCSTGSDGCTCGLGDPRYMQQAGLIAKLAPGLYAKERKKEQHTPGFAMPSSAWNQIQWLPCADGKARPIKPGIEPLAHGISGRVGRLRAYGNAIVPQLAAEFIKSALECIP